MAQRWRPSLPLSKPSWGSSMEIALALGLDFGTSGARAAVIDLQGQVVGQVRCAYPAVDQSLQADSWRQTLLALLERIPLEQRQQLRAIALDGTSSTVMLCDRQGRCLVPPLLYNDDSGRTQLPRLQQIAPPQHPVISATSSLAKLLWWQKTLPPQVWSSARYLLHQADWLAFWLHGQLGLSDYHNALKLGYDAAALTYPSWLQALEIAALLPQVRVPGSAIAPLLPELCDRFGMSPTCQVCAGTTDSIAAFLASGASRCGDAVTSLGSTLVLKLLSQHRVDDSYYGVYSHRLGDLWLVGGASNTGGAVLRHFFSDQELKTLSEQIEPARASLLDYYPLLQPGERFPINDPLLPPRLTPQPSDRVAFLHGLLEGIARIERQGYCQLEALGASPIQRLYSAGGGAQNSSWTAIRQRVMQQPILAARHLEAAVGAARLAAASLAPSGGA